MSLLLLPTTKVKVNALLSSQWFYALFFKSELGLNQNTSDVNTTFIIVNKTNSQIIFNQTNS